MTIQGNYEILDAINRDIFEIQQSSPALSFLLADKIKSFRQKNGLRINALNNHRESLLKQYVMLDADGNPLIKEENGQKQYVWPSEEAKEAFAAAITDYLTSITFNIEG